MHSSKKIRSFPSASFTPVSFPDEHAFRIAAMSARMDATRDRLLHLSRLVAVLRDVPGIVPPAARQNQSGPAGLHLVVNHSDPLR